MSVPSWVAEADQRNMHARAIEDASVAPIATPRLPTDSAKRKNYPLGTGVLDYFPDALAEVARVSKVAGDKHHPGEITHWERGKSGDHWDCLLRHGIERGTMDTANGVRHSGQLAWRALALLQEEIETDLGLPLSRASVLPQR